MSERRMPRQTPEGIERNAAYAVNLAAAEARAEQLYRLLYTGDGQAESATGSAAASIRERHQRGEALEAIVDDEARRILEIAAGPETADHRMEQICRINPAMAGWTSPRWAKLLGVSDAAVRQLTHWKYLRTRRKFLD